MPETIEAACPQCHRQYRVPAAHLGKAVSCKCGKKFTLSQASPVPAKSHRQPRTSAKESDGQEQSHRPPGTGSTSSENDIQLRTTRLFQWLAIGTGGIIASIGLLGVFGIGKAPMGGNIAMLACGGLAVAGGIILFNFTVRIITFGDHGLTWHSAKLPEIPWTEIVRAQVQDMAGGKRTFILVTLTPAMRVKYQSRSFSAKVTAKIDSMLGHEGDMRIEWNMLMAMSPEQIASIINDRAKGRP